MYVCMNERLPTTSTAQTRPYVYVSLFMYVCSLGERREQHLSFEPPQRGERALRAGAGVAAQGCGAVAAEQRHPVRAFCRPTRQLTATLRLRNVSAARHIRSTEHDPGPAIHSVEVYLHIFLFLY